MAFAWPRASIMARATFDPHRARLDRQYPAAVAALSNVNVKTAYLDGELCGVDDKGLPSFARPRRRPTANAPST
jgi:hypothetical protein